MSGKTDHAFRSDRLGRIIRSRSRVLVSTGAGLALLALLPSRIAPTDRLLIAWDGTTLLYLVLVWLMARTAEVNDIKRRAARYDEGGAAILAIICLGAAASIAAIFVELAGIRAAPTHAPERLFVVVATVSLSWVTTHVMFAFHYAHEYYRWSGLDRRVALTFPDTIEPLYSDFLYFSFVIGCTAQTADISIASRPMRKIALMHGILAFVFNTAILALSINIGASLVSG
jgi:uncharacterized membrane protein